jgi:acetylglutamate kinase
MLGVRVVKVGGNELGRPTWVAECARALAAAPPVVIVHGGGEAVSAWSRRLGLPVEKRDGLRVTTPEVAEVVEMVLSGPVNRLLVTALRAAGLDAIGLSGADGGLLTARPAPGGLGHVGDITAVRASLLESLLLAGLTPVVAPVAPAAGDPDVPLNVNADYAAAAVAAALQAQELLFVSDIPGVEIDGVAQPTLAASEIEPLIALGIATNGMAAKLRAAAQALAAGVRAVRIGDLEMFENATAGTRLLAAPPARPAPSVIQPA